MKSLKSQNFYEILNISQYASQEDIRKAYEISKHTFQGDSMATYSLFSEEENEEIFALVTQAYETLRNPSLRREYDFQLTNQGLNGDVQGAEEDKMASPVLGRKAVKPAPSQPAPDSEAAKGGGATDTAGAKKEKKAAPEVPPGDERLEKYLDSVTTFDGPVLKKVRHIKGLSL